MGEDTEVAPVAPAGDPRRRDQDRSMQHHCIEQVRIMCLFKKKSTITLRYIQGRRGMKVSSGTEGEGFVEDEGRGV